MLLASCGDDDDDDDVTDAALVAAVPSADLPATVLFEDQVVGDNVDRVITGAEADDEEYWQSVAAKMESMLYQAGSYQAGQELTEAVNALKSMLVDDM